MKRIGILSDTHGFVHPELPRIFEACDEIWHAGDFGNFAVAEALQAIKPLKGVFGNIDGQEVRISFPKYQRFMCEEVDVLMTHIGGYPGHYSPDVRQMLIVKPPKLFVCGHSHILKVMFDKRFNMLTINPGAAGKSGFHKTITMIRFTIDGADIRELEVVEFQR
ncbi:MAG: metallophosphatase family protein [Bacteroidales bacterium]|nr:metallophosphatase family protein [Bacteroidales bacterium]